jgi:hypothetical protein
MIETFEDAYAALAGDVTASSFPQHHPLSADPWVMISLLQKAIRRGETDMAERAALTLLQQRPSSLWRRLMVIAFEDVGAGDADAVVKTVVACESPKLREGLGGDAKVAVTVARMLADAPKDRCADYVICAAKDHPAMEGMREIVGSRSVPERLTFAADESLGLVERSIAVWYASGIEWGREHRVGAGDLPALLALFRSLNVPAALADASGFAAVRTREPICLMVPLIWREAFKDEVPEIEARETPPSPEVDGIPLYAFDKHTRIGLRAIQTFARENRAVSACLEEYVPEHRHRDAAGTAAFYADAAPIDRRLKWRQVNALTALGIRNDLLVAGVTHEGMGPLLAAVRDNLDHLNAIRARLFTASRRSAGGGKNQPDLL